MHSPTRDSLRRLALLAALVAPAAIGGCNTVKGIGQDIEAGAAKTQEWISGDGSSTRQSKAESKN